MSFLYQSMPLAGLEQSQLYLPITAVIGWLGVRQ